MNLNQLRQLTCTLYGVVLVEIILNSLDPASHVEQINVPAAGIIIKALTKLFHLLKQG